MSKPTSKRPSRNSDFVIKSTAEEFAPKVKAWLNDDSTLESIREDLEQAMKYGASDGYGLAKRLDDNGWSPDSELVEILDSASFVARKYERKQNEDWVKVNGLQPPAIGQLVTFELFAGHGNQAKQVDGEVTKNETDGRSVVCCPSLGHVKEGIGSHGYYVEWERLSPANENKEIA